MLAYDEHIFCVTFNTSPDCKYELMSELSTESDEPERENSSDQPRPSGLQYLSCDLSRDYMFPPLEPTVLPRFWSYNGRTKPVPRGPSLYYEEPTKPKKVITWDEANDARPPLRIDMEGPGPTNYSPRNKPLNETNSPAWTFGSKCFIEKAGAGSRTSWEKTWFQNPEVWTSKVDFYNDSAWPTPTHYRHRPALGPRQRTMVEAPSFTIGTRRETTFSKQGSDKEPSPVDYDKDTADKIVLKKAPAFSHQFRREGTVVWANKEKVPGPGAYNPKFSYNKHHSPAFTIRSLRREKSHVLGPFSTF